MELAKMSHPLAATTHSEKSKLPKADANRLQSGAFLSTVGKEKAFCLLGTFCYENVILTLSEGLLRMQRKES